MKTFLDTNVLVYAFDGAEPVKQERARELLREADPESLVVSTQVLSEFFVVVTRKLATPLTLDVAAAAVQEFSALQVVATDSALVRKAIEHVAADQVSYWDALIIAAAIQGSCTHILTEDLQAGRHLGSLQVVNPFA